MSAHFAAGTSNQVVTFTAEIQSGVAEGTEVVNTARIWSVEQPQAIEATATTVVSSPEISFDNTHTLFDEVNVTIRGLNLGQANASPTPKVSLVFPAGTAVSNKIPADAVMVSEDGTQLMATFHLWAKSSHPSPQPSVCNILRWGNEPGGDQF